MPSLCIELVYGLVELSVRYALITPGIGVTQTLDWLSCVGLCCIVRKMGTHVVQRDATAEVVSANVKRLRTEQNLGLRALADRLESIRPSIKHSTVDAIERGTRRVDVDDLVALALVLNTSPIGLLLPHGNDPAELVPVGKNNKVPAERFWRWLRGEASVVTSLSDLGLIVNTQPVWQQAAASEALLAWLGSWKVAQEGPPDGDN